MLKKKITKEAFDALHEELKQFYKVGGDPKFFLLDVEEDTGALDELGRAKEHEVGLRRIAERDLAAARTDLETATARIAELERTQSSTSQELRADHERTVNKLKEDHRKATENLEKTIKKIYVNDVASKIASDIAIDEGAAELLGEVIARRLSVEMVNGEPVTRVLNADGTASNATPDQLKTEYLQMEKFASMLRANEASGGGASGGGKGGGASGKKLDDLGDEERNKMAKDDPAGLQRLIDEAAAAAE
jgi:hypothetical protein